MWCCAKVPADVANFIKFNCYEPNWGGFKMSDNRFAYLLSKIENAEFDPCPFQHITINNFFSEADFAELQSLKQIKLGQCNDTAALLKQLKRADYEVITFPGSITSEQEYLKFDGDGEFKRGLIKGYGKKVIEGYGITYRLSKYHSAFLQDLMAMLEGDVFLDLLKSKFSIDAFTEYEGGVQKNLRGYEISPHPDTSRKALTWMINIYTDEDDVSTKDMHTHLCEFKKEYSYIYEVWKHSDFDPVWVPWDWADTVKKTNTNNSITIFRPSHKTLHAVTVREDHLVNQRNQIYGNLWYEKPNKNTHMPWERLDLYRKETFVEKVLRNIK